MYTSYPGLVLKMYLCIFVSSIHDSFKPVDYSREERSDVDLIGFDQD
jgi:hypothetical protein